MKTFSMPVSNAESEKVPCVCCGSSVFKPALVCESFSFVSCNSCSLVQQNPRPVQKEIIARYRKIFGDDYLSYELKNEAAFLMLQELALKDAGFSKLEKALFSRAGEPPCVLDIGCATGALLAKLRDRHWRVSGVEISPCAEYAQKERMLDVRTLPLEENNFPDSSFDVVLASHLIEHLNDPKSFLTEAHRILKENGRIFITTPNIDSFQSRLYKAAWRSAIFDHLYLFSKRTLKKLLTDTGFKTESIRTWGGLAAGITHPLVKRTADFLAKSFNYGDVMIVRAIKI